MARRRQVVVTHKPKNWSIGLFFGAVMWIIGDSLWDLGYNLLWLLWCVVFSFIMDKLCTGKTSEDNMYID